MNRRSFLKLFAAAGPAAAIAPTYFFAPIGGWKSDLIINPNLPLRFVDLRAKDYLDALYANANFLLPQFKMAFPAFGAAALVKIIEEQAEAMRKGQDWQPVRLVRG